MTTDELHRLLIAPELIVVDLADATLVALRRALLAQHPMALGEPRADQPRIRRRAVVILRHAGRLERALEAYRTTADQIIDDHRAEQAAPFDDLHF